MKLTLMGKSNMTKITGGAAAGALALTIAAINTFGATVLSTFFKAVAHTSTVACIFLLFEEPKMPDSLINK